MAKRYRPKKKGEWGLLYGALKRLPEKATKAALRQLKKEALIVEDVAKKMAPVDFGDLENAIKMKQVDVGRDSGGRFQKNQFVIGLDPNYPCKDPKDPSGKRVGDYALVVHEYLPWGTDQKVPAPWGGLWGLGEKSLAKQARVAPLEVGGGFMYRAFEYANSHNDIAHRVGEVTFKALEQFFKKGK